MTELTGNELQAVFQAAVSDAWKAAAERGFDVHGSTAEQKRFVRKPDGAVIVEGRTGGSPPTARKRTAA